MTIRTMHSIAPANVSGRRSFPFAPIVSWILSTTRSAKTSAGRPTAAVISPSETKTACFSENERTEFGSHVTTDVSGWGMRPLRRSLTSMSSPLCGAGAC